MAKKITKEENIKQRMEAIKSFISRRGAKIWFVLILWIVTGWLLYPLIAVDSVNLINVKEYLYRSAAGITIMIILLGKTICDLLFPLEISRKKSIFYLAFLTFYSLAILAGIIFMISRMMLVYYLKSSESGLSF
jgi:hypothetical protein